MTQLLIATKNKGKVREIQDLLKHCEIKVLSLSDLVQPPDVVEDGLTFRANAAKKAVEVALWLDNVRTSARPYVLTSHVFLVMGEDSGLEVDALNGRPGVHSARYSGEGATDEKFPGNERNDRNMFLAYQLQKSLTKALGAEDRGLRRARFAVLRDAQMPAVLIEAGFISHPDEGKKIYDPAYRRRIARAVVEGIQAYKRIVEQRA